MARIEEELWQANEELAALIDKVIAQLDRLFELVNEQRDDEHESKAHWVARAVAGEGAPYFDDPMAGIWIAHTAVNRSQTSWSLDPKDPRHNPAWSTDVREVVRSAFHGYINCEDPGPRALAAARGALEREDDMAEKCFFVLNHTDVVQINADMSKVIRSFHSESGHDLHFFRVWPERKEDT